MKPFMVQPHFTCNDNSTIWPHLWFFHVNVNVEGGSPNYPCIFRAQLTPQATDGRFCFQSKSAIVKGGGLLAFGAGPARNLCTPQTVGPGPPGRGLHRLCQVPGPRPWPAWQEMMVRLVPVDRTALNREGCVQTLQRVFLASAFLASSLLDGLSPGSAVVTPSPPGAFLGLLGYFRRLR